MYMPYSIMDIFTTISYEIMWMFSYAQIVLSQLYNQTILPIQKSELFKSIKEFIRRCNHMFCKKRRYYTPFK